MYDMDSDGIITVSDIEQLIGSEEAGGTTGGAILFDSAEEELAWFIESTGDVDGVFDEAEMMAYLVSFMDYVQSEYDK